jgi:hypothetical protein
VRNPTTETYRGAPIHVFQPAHRIALVKAAVDVVVGLSDPLMLIAYAIDASHPAEARGLAIDLLESTFELSTERPAGFDQAKASALAAKASIDEVIMIAQSSDHPAEQRLFWRSCAPMLALYAKDAANPREARHLAADAIKAAAQLAVSDIEAA